MTQKKGQNGPEKADLLPEESPAAEIAPQAEGSTAPQLLSDALIDPPADTLTGGHAAAPEIFPDASVVPAALKDLQGDADLPLVHGDRAGETPSPSELGKDGFEGLSILEDASVAEAIEDARHEASGANGLDLVVLEDSWKIPPASASSEGTDLDAPIQDEDGSDTPAEDAWGTSLRPLPKAIDLAALEVDRPKSFMSRIFARKMNAGPVASPRSEPVLVAEVAEPAKEEAKDLLPAIGEPAPETLRKSEEPEAPMVAPQIVETPSHKSWFSRGSKEKSGKAKKFAKTRKTPDRSRGNPPIQVIIGWIGESNRKDVIEHARGFASDHIESLNSAWISVSSFRDGHIFEVHEGGSGLSYMPDIIEQLTRDPDQVVWVPSGTVLNRVLTIRIAEDHVFSTILTEAESALVRSSGQDPLQRTGRMVRLVPKGTGALATGVSLAAVGAMTLIGAGYYASLINQQPLPSRTFNQENLPHNQIIRLSEGIRDDRWVSRIVFEDGQWRADFETVEEIVLPVDDAGAQAVIDDLYNEEERIKKAVDESIEKETKE